MRDEDLLPVCLMRTDSWATANERTLARAVVALAAEVEMLRKQVAGSVKWHTADL